LGTNGKGTTFTGCGKKADFKFLFFVMRFFWRLPEESEGQNGRGHTASPS
jgi:hypothetical protein